MLEPAVVIVAALQRPKSVQSSWTPSAQSMHGCQPDIREQRCCGSQTGAYSDPCRNLCPSVSSTIRHQSSFIRRFRGDTTRLSPVSWIIADFGHGESSSKPSCHFSSIFTWAQLWYHALSPLSPPQFAHSSVHHHIRSIRITWGTG
jgi:hypothetical protein